ncbi:unnamed protein product, partial [Linum tenue]
MTLCNLKSAKQFSKQLEGTKWAPQRGDWGNSYRDNNPSTRSPESLYNRSHTDPTTPSPPPLSQPHSNWRRFAFLFLRLRRVDYLPDQSFAILVFHPRRQRRALQQLRDDLVRLVVDAVEELRFSDVGGGDGRGIGGGGVSEPELDCGRDGLDPQPELFVGDLGRVLDVDAVVGIAAAAAGWRNRSCGGGVESHVI